MSLVNLLRPIGKLVSYVDYKVDRLRLARLMQRGMRVGRNVYIQKNVDFDPVYPFLIEIGDNSRISREVRVSAHDATIFRDLGVTRIAPVRILEGSFIGARATILPGVTIGPRAVIAAGALVNRDMGEGVMAAGNPARPYAKYADLLEKYAEAVRSSPVFAKDDMERGATSPDDVLRAFAHHPVAFVRGTPKRDPFYVNADFEQMGTSAMRAYEATVSRHLSGIGTQDERG